MFACNVGKTDKLIRVIIGIVIMLAGYFVFHSWWGLIGIVPIMTAIFGRCSFYIPFNINTTKYDKK